MKFESEKSEIVESLQLGASIAERRQTIPILANLKIVVENAFKYRRKKLINNLKHIIQDAKLNEIKDNRAEQLTVMKYQELSHFIIGK